MLLRLETFEDKVSPGPFWPNQSCKCGATATAWLVQREELPLSLAFCVQASRPWLQVPAPILGIDGKPDSWEQRELGGTLWMAWTVSKSLADCSGKAALWMASPSRGHILDGVPSHALSLPSSVC